MEHSRGEWNERPADERQALVFLDWASHELWHIDPSAFDESRRLVKAAGAYDLIFSLPLIENADAANLFLSEDIGDARPDTLVYLRLPDVDALAAAFGVEVEDAPWAREIELRNPDGNRLRIGTPHE